MIRRCMDCPSLVRMRDGDYDTPAVCEDCRAQSVDAAQQLREVTDQAGAQWVGLQRETRGIGTR